MSTESTLMKGVERINVIIMYPNQQTVFIPQQDLYAMEMSCGNRNCYNCGGFGHMEKHCRNRETGGRIGKGRKL